jgi:hypothetical protein
MSVINKLDLILKLRFSEDRDTVHILIRFIEFPKNSQITPLIAQIQL